MDDPPHPFPSLSHLTGVNKTQVSVFQPGFPTSSSPNTCRMTSPRATNTMRNQAGISSVLSDTSHLNVDLLTEGSFLQFKSPSGLCYFGICHELDIQHFLLALCLL